MEKNINNIEIPIPKPEEKQKDNSINLDEIKNKINNVHIPDYFERSRLVENKKTKHAYIFFILMIIASVSILVISFLSNWNLIIKAIAIFLTVVFLLIFFFYLMIRIFLFGDLQKLRNLYIMYFGDYVQCHFFGMNKRIYNNIYIPEQEGKEIHLGKGKDEQIYLVDYDSVFIDTNNIPHLFYIRGIPNPLNFDFISKIKRYYENIANGKPELNIKDDIDIRYSSTTLKQVKNDDYLSKMHKNRDAEKDKLIMLIFILFIVFVVALIIVILIMSKPPQVINTINATAQAI